MALALIALLVIGILAGSGIAGRGYVRDAEAQLVAHFTRGQADLEAGRTLLKQAANDHRPDLIPQAEDRFRAGRSQFAAVRDDPNLARLGPLAGLPYIKPRAAAVRHLGVMGIALSDAGISACGIETLLLSKPSDDQKGQGAKRVVAILSESRPLVASARASFSTARAEAAAVDPSVLPGSQRKAFAAARASIDKGIAGLDEFDHLSPVLSEVLGANGPRYYLIEQLNQTELRAGGGYFGTYSVLSADQGTLKVERSGDTHQLPDFNVVKGQPGYVDPPPTLVEFLDRRSWALEDTNWLPDFPANAKAAQLFTERDLGRQVDGVFAIDLNAIAAMLQLTGPITVPGLGTVNSGNLVDTATRLDVSNDPKHKSVLLQLTGPLMDRITNLGSDQWPQLVNVLNSLAAQRHLQVYFNRDIAQQEMQRFSWTGQLEGGRAADYMYPVESNFGGNKANYWLTRTYDLTLTHRGAQLHHRLAVDLTLDRHTFVSPFNAFYRCYFRLYTPASATNLTITNVKGDKYPNTSVPEGLRLVDGWQQINPNLRTQVGELEIVYEWDTAWAPDAHGDHLLYWQKQPGTGSDKVTVHFMDGSKADLVTDIAQDRLFKVRQGSVTVANGLVPAAHLPSAAG